MPHDARPGRGRDDDLRALGLHEKAVADLEVAPQDVKQSLQRLICPGLAGQGFERPDRIERS